METLLLPESIGDSQPRDRRLPASSLHSATAGRKRRAELMDTTGGMRKRDRLELRSGVFRCDTLCRHVGGAQRGRSVQRHSEDTFRVDYVATGSLRHVVTSPVGGRAAVSVVTSSTYQRVFWAL